MEWRCCRCLAVDPVPEPTWLGHITDSYLRSSGRRWWKRDIQANVHVTTCAGCVLGQEVEFFLRVSEDAARSKDALIRALDNFQVRSSTALTQHLTDQGQPPAWTVWTYSGPSDCK